MAKSFIEEIEEVAIIPDSELSEFPEIREIQVKQNEFVRDKLEKLEKM